MMCANCRQIKQGKGTDALDVLNTSGSQPFQVSLRIKKRASSEKVELCEDCIIILGAVALMPIFVARGMQLEALEVDSRGRPKGL